MPRNTAVDRAVVVALCRLAGIPPAPEVLESITPLLHEQLDRVALLGEVDTLEVEPIVSFDPRWI